MGSGFIKRDVISGVCLLLCMIYMVLPLRVQASEENNIPQSSSAKVYNSMSNSSDILANLIVGNVFEVLGTENDSDGGMWYRIRTDFGVEGYVKAQELDRMITDSRAMLSVDIGSTDDITAGEQAAEDPAPETDKDNAGEPDPQHSSQEELPDKDVSDTGDDTGNQLAPETASINNSDDIEQELGGEMVPEDDSMLRNQIPDSDTAADVIAGAGFGKMEDSLASEDAVSDSDGFTVVERTEGSGMYRHGRIDAVLIMIIAGGILCIVAIAVLTRKMWTSIKTGT